MCYFQCLTNKSNAKINIHVYISLHTCVSTSVGYIPRIEFLKLKAVHVGILRENYQIAVKRLCVIFHIHQ